MEYQSPTIMEMGKADELVQCHLPICDEFRGCCGDDMFELDD
jgi:hypothetical protein